MNYDLHLARKYKWIFASRHYLFRGANESDARGKLWASRNRSYTRIILRQMEAIVLTVLRTFFLTRRIAAWNIYFSVLSDTTLFN